MKLIALAAFLLPQRVRRVREATEVRTVRPGVRLLGDAPEAAQVSDLLWHQRPRELPQIVCSDSAPQP